MPDHAVMPSLTRLSVVAAVSRLVERAAAGDVAAQAELEALAERLERR